MQHRRLRLRSASQGSAPAPAAQHHSTATRENQEHLTKVRTGNSVSPLDKTYHGGPRTIWKCPRTVNAINSTASDLMKRTFTAGERRHSTVKRSVGH